MAVNLTAKSTEQLASVAGVTLAITEAGIRYHNRKDLLVIRLDKGNTVAGVFTRNRFCAAPVQLCKQHLDAGVQIRALIINTGSANAGTGQDGLTHAEIVCQALASNLECRPEQILPFSTGVILEPLPYEKIVTALPLLRSADWSEAAQTIMTTDTVPKGASRSCLIDGHAITVTGIAKGSGMIHPDMATMLCFLATDAAITRSLLNQLVRELAEDSFNNITVDGDTSTNDSFILISTGQSDLSLIDSSQHPAYAELRTLLMEVAIELAQSIVRDGEGASKFISIHVEGGRTRKECKAVAYAIAHSPLVKTAFSASDPNLGRILAAIGYADVDELDASRVDVFLGGMPVVQNGQLSPDYQETEGQRIMAADEITVEVNLNRGASKVDVWTCDLTHEYVSINADYRS